MKLLFFVDEEEAWRAIEVWEGVAPRRKLKKLKIKVEEELLVGGVCPKTEVEKI